MTFRNSILAGLTLIREAIRSQNYQAGVEGWTINADGTAEFSDLTIRSSDGSGATVVVENGKATFTAANGWKIIIDPTNTLPIIYFLDGDGDESGALNATGDNTRSGVILSSGPFTDGPVTDWRWALFQGEKAGTNSWHALRLRDSDPDEYEGGWIYMDGTLAQFAVVDSTDPAVNTIFQVQDGIFIMDEGRLLLSPDPSAFPALFVNITAAGHTGNLLHLQREGSGKLTVDTDGNLAALGDIETFGDLYVSNVDQGRGLKDFTAITANAATVTTTETVGITSGSVGFENGRAYRVTVRAWVQSSVTGDVVQSRLRKTNAAGQQYFDTFRTHVINGAATQSSMSYQAIIRNVSGATVTAPLAVTYFRASGTGNVFMGGNATNPSWVQIEDIGAAADYPSANAIT